VEEERLADATTLPTVLEWIVRIFFIKIDTKGFEWKVLDGAGKYEQ